MMIGIVVFSMLVIGVVEWSRAAASAARGGAAQRDQRRRAR